MNIPPTNELVAFQKVANRLSFRKASEELNVTPSTLSHLIRSLEERLKTRLLNRTTRSVSLTDAGTRLFAQLNTLLVELSDALDGLHEEASRPGGTVRINTSEVAARIFLRKFEPLLRAKYPDIHLEMFVEDGFTDIVSEGFDAGIRLRDMVPEDMIAVPLDRRFRFVLVASPDYIEKHGLPKKPQDLLKHDCIHFRFHNGRLHEWSFRKHGRKVSVDVKGPMTLNHNGLVIEAAIKGLGIAHLPEALIEEELFSNRLVILLDDWFQSFPGLCLYYPKSRYLPLAFRCLLSVLRENV